METLRFATMARHVQRRATLVDGEVPLSMTNHFGTDGLIDNIRAGDGGRTVGERIIPTPWEGRMFD